jgi:FG-GAP-like repeat
MRKNYTFFILLFCPPFFTQAQTAFKDVTEAAGIKHQFEVFEGFLGGGACVLDVNNDGFDDVFLTGGKVDDILYLNNKNGTFTNIYEQSGLIGSKNYLTQGAVAADVNRDGWVDLYITTITSKTNPKSYLVHLIYFILIMVTIRLEMPLRNLAWILTLLAQERVLAISMPMVILTCMWAIISRNIRAI